MLALTGGRIIDGTGNTPLEKGVVLVEDKKIKAVGPVSHIDIPPECRCIDVRSKTVLPGLMDLHVHFCLGEGDVLAPQVLLPPFLDKPIALLGIRGFAHATSALEAGFTTLRGCGDVEWIDVSIRDAIHSGIVDGPRVIASGQFLSPTGGHWDFLPPWLSRSDLSSNLADGPEGVRKAVRQNIKMKTDWVKFCATGGVMNAHEKTFNFTDEELEILVDEAHSKGLRVAAHCIHHKGTLDAVKAGVDSVEHGTMLTDEIIELMLANGTFLIPTLYAPYTIVAKGTEFGLPQAYVDKCRPIAETHIESFQKAVKAGVKIAYGTDAGMTSVIHGDNACELELLVKFGMTPMEAIITATRASAQCLNLDQEVGSLQAGMLADLIVVKGNPLDDIGLLKQKQNISIVIKEGRILNSKKRPLDP